MEIAVAYVTFTGVIVAIVVIVIIVVLTTEVNRSGTYQASSASFCRDLSQVP
jgi:hypothetical protein